VQIVSCLCPAEIPAMAAPSAVPASLFHRLCLWILGNIGSGHGVSETSFDIIRSHLRHSARNDHKSVVRGQVKSIHFGFRGHKASSAEYSRADWDLHANHPARLRVLASSSLASLFQGKQVRWRSIVSQQHNHQQKCKRQSTSNLRFRRESGDSKAALLAVD
jgi:hypothetical protein